MKKNHFTCLKRLAIFGLVLSIVSSTNSTNISASDIISNDIVSDTKVVDSVVTIDDEIIVDNRTLASKDNWEEDINIDNNDSIFENFNDSIDDANIDNLYSNESCYEAPDDNAEYISSKSENSIVNDLIPIEGFETEEDVEVVYDCDAIYEDYLNYLETEGIEGAEDGNSNGIDYLKIFFDNNYNINYEDEIESAIYKGHEWDRYSSNYAYNRLSAQKKVAWLAMDSLCYTALTTTKSYSSAQLPYISSSSLYN